MRKIEAVCVFCGSSMGADPAYEETARTLGGIFAASRIRLVYGGGGIGLMGTAARATLSGGGKVTGIIPGFLRDREVQLDEVTELIVTQSMHQRKATMHRMSDAFVILAGGIGTLEEVIEIMTWAQLGLHEKPVLFVNTNGYYNPLFGFLDHVITEGFAKPAMRRLYGVVERPEEVLPALTAWPQAALAAVR